MRNTPQLLNRSFSCAAYFGYTEGRLRPNYHFPFSPLAFHHEQKVANTRYWFFQRSKVHIKVSVPGILCAGVGNKAIMQPSPNIMLPVRRLTRLYLTHFPDWGLKYLITARGTYLVPQALS